MHAAGDTPGDAPPPAGLGLALIAAPGPAEELARALADELPARLGERIQPPVTWSVPVAVEPAVGEAGWRRRVPLGVAGGVHDGLPTRFAHLGRGRHGRRD